METKVKHSILFSLIIIPFIPFLLAVGVSFYFFSTTLETNTNRSLKRVVEDHREMIDAFLMERKADLELVQASFDLQTIGEKAVMDRTFKTLSSQSEAFIDLGLFDAKGHQLRYAGRYQWLEGKNYGEEFWFKQVMDQDFYISDVFLGYRNSPHFIIAVKKGRGENAWVLRASIDTLFFDQLVSRVGLGRTGHSYILNKAGVSQTHPGEETLLDLPHPGSGIQTFIREDDQGRDHLYAVTRLGNKDWYLVVRQEKKDAYRSLYSAFYISLLIMVIGGGAIVTLAVWTTAHTVKKIDRLGLEKEQLGSQLIRATQLAEIGEMAAGFAHEINNPLQIIKNENALILTLLDDIRDLPGMADNPDIEDVAVCVGQIRLQVDRCADITHSILKFGRKKDISLTSLSPGECIPEIVHLVADRAKVNGVEIIQNMEEGIPRFKGDASRFQQVILNLLNNAMDAIEERHGAVGGVLRIDCTAKENTGLEIRIQDNGIGIRPEYMGKVFSPFFTTKPVGKGTGLGLSVCFGIIENFGGTMAVESRQGVGTTFVITLPAANQKERIHGEA